MRQRHRAGEKLFVDYASQTVPVIDPTTGQTQEAQIFVAVLGGSSFTYAEATSTQTLPDWIASHQRAFQFFGGVPEIVVPDNLQERRHEGPPLRARSQPHLCRDGCSLRRGHHTGPATRPERQGKGRAWRARGRALDPSLAAPPEVLLAGRAELNEAIGELLDRLYERPFGKLPGSRRSRFEALDEPALRPLPATKYI